MGKRSKIQLHFRLGHYVHLIKLLQRGLTVGGTEISRAHNVARRKEGEGMMRQWKKYLEIILAGEVFGDYFR